jgi:hypothetical protein
MVEEGMGIIEDRPIDRAIGILMGTVGIMGCIMPFTKQPMRDAFQISMAGIGAVLTIYSVISKTTTTTKKV